MAGEFLSARARSWGSRASASGEANRADAQWLRQFAESAPATALLSQRPWCAEVRALQSEPNRELFAEGLNQLAGRLERSGEARAIPLAAEIYRHLSEMPGIASEDARRRAAALIGEGSFSERWEGSLRGFARQATDPVMLAALGLASSVATVARATILSRLLSTGRPAFWGISAPVLARSGALAMEAPTWVLAERGLRRWAGHAGAEAPLNEQLASAVLTLGTLRIAETLPLHPFGAQLGGIFLANRVEQGIGLRPRSDLASSLGDSLLFLAQSQVAGHLSRRLMGGAWSDAQGRLEARSEMLSDHASFLYSNILPGWANFAPAFAANLNSPGRLPGSNTARDFSHIVFNQAHQDGAGKPLPTLPFPRGGENPGNGGNGPRSSLIGRRLSQLGTPNFESLKSPVLKEISPSGPRRRIGLLTSGGDGPGENAAIAALVRGASEVYGWEIAGIWDGYRGLLEPDGRIRPLFVSDIEGPSAVNAALRQIYGRRWEPDLMHRHADIMALGGNILRSSRTNPVAGDPDASRVKATMREHGLEGLIVMGGNGSMRAAAELDRAGVPVVFLPQSIDADVPGSELSIGFPSAVAKGVSELQHFYHTGQSCDRWFFVEVMGQHFGALSLNIAYQGRADGIFTEIPRGMGEIVDLIRRRAASGQKHGVVIVSESVVFAGEHGGIIEPPRGVDQNGRLLVESGDIAKWLSAEILAMGIPHTRSAPLGYLLRGAWPSPEEIELASTLSRGALHLISGGEWGKMVGLRFFPRSSDFEMVFPNLKTVARQSRRLDRRMESLVREVLEG